MARTSLLTKIYFTARKNKLLFAIVRGLHDICWKSFGTVLNNIRSETKLDGFRFVIRSFNWPDRASALENYELWEKFVIVKEGSTALDIGANIGRHSLLLARKVGPQGKVISVEPDPNNFELLLTNIKINSIVTIIPLKTAVWNRKAELQLHVDPQTSLHYVTERTDNSAKGGNTIQATTVDYILTDLGISEAGFIKIDVEGAELRVLQGSSRTLRDMGPDLIVEVHHGEKGLVECKQFLEGLGYTTQVLVSKQDDPFAVHDILHIYATKRKFPPA